MSSTPPNRTTSAASSTVPAPAPVLEQYVSCQSDMMCNRHTVNVEGRAYKTQKSEKNPGPNVDALHPWEKCGLGVAPYRMVGCGEMTYQACPGAPIQPGTCCDYCGAGLMNVFFIRAACGSTFKVGCDCVRKVCDAREGVRTVIEAAVRKHQRELRAKSTAKKNASVQEQLDTLVAANYARLQGMPHPRGFAGRSFADYVVWMLEHSGAAGRGRLLKEIQAALKAGDGE